LTNEEIIREIFESEGWDTYTDRAADRGGPTRWGITEATLKRWYGKEWAVGDRGGIFPKHPSQLGEWPAFYIYEQEFINAPGFDKITNDRLRYLMVDCGVLHGPGRATKWLQRALGVVADGKIGPVTLLALDQVPPPTVYMRVCRRRIQFIGRIVTQDKVMKQALNANRGEAWGVDLAAAQIHNLNGWLNRATKFLVM
jgi:lysozyme family protein